MRTSALIPSLFISAAAIAQPVFIDEPAHDSTLPEHAQDVSSNGAGNWLILDRNTGGDARSRLISYQSYGVIPDHALNRIVQLHHLFWSDPPAMTGDLLRITATWCEGGAHPAGEKHSAPGEFLWVTANPVTLDESIFDRMFAYPTLLDVPGTLDNKAAQAEPQPCTTPGADFDNRTVDGSAPDGLDCDQAIQLVMPVGIENLLCQ